MRGEKGVIFSEELSIGASPKVLPGDIMAFEEGNQVESFSGALQLDDVALSEERLADSLKYMEGHIAALSTRERLLSSDRKKNVYIKDIEAQTVLA